MSEAFEVSPDDPQQVAAAIERAAHGSTVRVVRDGRPLADIVPASRPAAPEYGAWPAARDPRHDAVVRAHANRFGAPGLEHYRRVYAAAGREWPGEDWVRSHYPVADAS